MVVAQNDFLAQYEMPSEIPHRYQDEVFERAQKENIIAALNTGSGKTLISLLLIKWISAQTSSKGKVVIFLVPKITLVTQQYEYLKKRTPLRIGKLHGSIDAGRSLDDRPGWKLFFDNHDVAVMTAQIFLNIVTHSLWAIDKVSLMIFDECHHTRKNHPYNGIMREYFHVADASRRPKIFGMTASPIWNTKNPLGSIATLESNMDANVISVVDNADELLEYSPKAAEEMVYYPIPPLHFDYPSPSLHDYLKVIDQASWKELDIPWSKIVVRYYSTLNNVGPYSASMFLFLELRYHLENFLVENRRCFMDCMDNGTSNAMKAPLGLANKNLPDDLFLILDILEEFSPFFPANGMITISPIPVPLEWCTPKVRVLCKILADYHTHSPSFQGIIFVEQRQIASALAKVLPVIPELAGKINCAFIVGQGVNRDGVSKQTDRFPGDPVVLFRKRSINILIATSVAEEGLDFPDCELVIRFDELHHMIGYVQSRGRARNKTSAKFIVMIQENNAPQIERFLTLQAAEPKINREYQTRHAILQEDSDEQEDDKEHTDEKLYQADLLDRERYIEPSTGATITYDNALNLLSYLCSLIPRDAFTPTLKPRYIEGFRTRLSLPRALPLPAADLNFTGPCKLTHREAKRAVAFMAVKRLREMNVFDEYLLPVPASSDEFEGTMSQLKGKGRKGKSVPIMLTVPVRDPWCIGDKLWLHPIVIDGRAAAGLVTGTPLLPEDTMINVKRVTTLPARLLHFEAETELELRTDMKEFTRLGVTYNNTARPLSSSLNLYLVPITPEHEPDFKAIRRLLDHPRGSEDWTHISKEDYDRLLVVNIYRSGSVYLLRNIRNDLSPMSVPSPGSRECRYPTYQDFWLAKWTLKNRSITIPSTGPILEVVKLSRSNMAMYPLDQSEEYLRPVHSVADGRLFPQATCKWLPLSYSVREAFEILPVLSHRLTTAYRARCARSELGLPFVPDNLMVEALTIPSTLLPFNNQRLETLGDAVLQVCTTVHLLNQYPNRHEGQLTKLRQKVVGNAFLMHRALDLGLEKFVNSEVASVHTWRYVLPENTSVYGDGDMPIRYATRQYPRRSLQDCMEALLGASFISGGIQASLKMGTALGLEFGGPLPWHMRYAFDGEAGDIASLFFTLEQSLGYKFRYNHLLLESLSHPSVTYSEAPTYQRLEFLGDAILDLVVIKYLFDKFPNATSHELAHPRTKAICAPTLANIGVRKLGLHNYILMNSMELSHAIDAYAPVLSGLSGAEIVRSSWKYDPPKVLSDVFESVIGAVLVDSGYDYEKTAGVVEYVMDDVLAALSPAVELNPVSELLEWAAGLGCTRMSFRAEMKRTELWVRQGITVFVHDQPVVGPIVSASLSVAKFLAAERALAMLRDDGSHKSLSVLCDCKLAVADLRAGLLDSGMDDAVMADPGLHSDEDEDEGRERQDIGSVDVDMDILNLQVQQEVGNGWVLNADASMQEAQGVGAALDGEENAALHVDCL